MTGKTPEQIIALAGNTGFLIYARGPGDPDAEGMQSALDRGLLVKVRDIPAAGDAISGGQRSEYKLTKKGQSLLRSGQ